MMEATRGTLRRVERGERKTVEREERGAGGGGGRIYCVFRICSCSSFVLTIYGAKKGVR